MKINKYVISYVLLILLRAYSLFCRHYNNYETEDFWAYIFLPAIISFILLGIFYLGKYLLQKHNHFIFAITAVLIFFVQMFLTPDFRAFDLLIAAFLGGCYFVETKLIPVKVRSNFKDSLSIEIIEQDKTRWDSKYLWSGFLIFILSIFFLEKFHHPYFFTNDDNFHQFLPSILWGCRSLFNQGIFAEINPYQNVGIPLASAGVYALTYPFTYLSYAFSRFVLHNEYATLDVFCILHLVIAYFSAYYAAKSCGVKDYLRVAFALFYSLSGYNLVFGRSWYYIAPVSAFAPLMIVSINYLVKNKPNLKWILSTGLVLGLLFHAGNVQMWVYTVMFFAMSVFLMFLLKKINFKRMLWAILPVILAVAIAGPLLIVSLELFKHIQRNPIENVDILFQNFPAILVPNGIINFLQNPLFNLYYGEALFSGGIFIFICAVAVLSVIQHPKNRLFRFIEANPWLIIGLIALWIGFGENWGLWNIIHSLPMLNNFTTPHKLTVFVNLFLNLAGVIILSRQKLIEDKKFRNGFCLTVLAIFCFHIYKANNSPFNYMIEPYADVSKIEQSIHDLRSHRVMSLAMERSGNLKYPLSMANNFATVYGIYSTNAYDDDLEQSLPENAKLYKLENFYNEYGVKYVFYQHFVRFPIFKMAEIVNEEFLDTQPQYKKIYKDSDNITIYQTKWYKPLAYVQDTLQPLKINFTGFGAIVDTSDLTKTSDVVVNMIYFPNYRAYLDGGKQTKINKDSYNRIVINIGQGNKILTVKYHSPWEKGYAFGGVLLLIFVCGLIILRRYDNG